MKITRTCKTCFHKTSGLCTNNLRNYKCSLYEIDYDYFNKLYSRAIKQAPGELKEQLKQQQISVYSFIEQAL